MWVLVGVILRFPRFLVYVNPHRVFFYQPVTYYYYDYYYYYYYHYYYEYEYEYEHLASKSLGPLMTNHFDSVPPCL